MTDTRYEDLMARRTALFQEWMKRVEAAKQFDADPSFYGTGVILAKDGTLRISAFDRFTGRGLWDLTIAPFSTQIEETRA